MLQYRGVKKLSALFRGDLLLNILQALQEKEVHTLYLWRCYIKFVSWFIIEKICHRRFTCTYTKSYCITFFKKQHKENLCDPFDPFFCKCIFYILELIDSWVPKTWFEVVEVFIWLIGKLFQSLTLTSRQTPELWTFQHIWLYMFHSSSSMRKTWTISLFFCVCFLR